MKWILFVFTLNADGVYESESIGYFETESLCNQVARTIERSNICIGPVGKEVEVWRFEPAK